MVSPGTPVSSTNKIDCHDITEILLKVALKHHNPNPLPFKKLNSHSLNIDNLYIQPNLSYVTFQRNSEIWSYKTGGHLIQI